MKNYVSLLVMLVVSVYAMDYVETQPEPNKKLQLIIANKNTTEDQFKNIIIQHPNLCELTITDHSIQQLSTNSTRGLNLTKINLSNGLLHDSNTLVRLLNICTVLRECILSNNKLTTVCESTLPQHSSLQILDCSNNNIKIINFTELRKKLPNLSELNVSACPLTTFVTDNMERNALTPTVYLSKTQLSRETQCTIIRDSKTVDILYAEGKSLSKDECSCGVNGAICSTAGGALGLLTGVSLYLWQVAPAMYMGILPGVGIVAGPIVGYFGSIGCVNPVKREIIIFNPIFDQVPKYTEEEVTTHYQRFIRHFPYICNIVKCGTSKSKSDSEYISLDDIQNM